MPRQVVWVCDKCHNDVVNEKLPLGFTEIKVTQGDEEDNVYIFCRSCWNEVLKVKAAL